MYVYHRLIIKVCKVYPQKKLIFQRICAGKPKQGKI